MKHFAALIFSFICLTTPAAAEGQFSGYLGGTIPYQMRAGQTYDSAVNSYTFTPGIYWYTPSGTQLCSAPEAVLQPWHDGYRYVYSTRSKFYAAESGTYQMQVFSWDNSQPGQTYSMVLHLLGEVAQPENQNQNSGARNDPVAPKVDCGLDNSPTSNWNDLPCVATRQSAQPAVI